MISEQQETKLLNLPIGSVDPNPWQPRRYFHPDELKTLSTSISQEGVLQPVLVSKHPVLPDRYFLLAGERRFRAAKLAGLSEIPATLKETSYTEEDQLRLALIENIQRSNLNIVEEAKAYKFLVDRFGYTHEECAKKLGRDRLTITNALRILNLPKEIHEDLVARNLNAGHARALASLSSKNDIFDAREQVLKKSLNVRQTEKLCKQLKQKRVGAFRAKKESDPDLQYLESSLGESLGSFVELKGSAEKGKIQITYYSKDEFHTLVETLTKKSPAN